MTQQVHRVRRIEDAVRIRQQLSEAPPDVRGSVSDVQYVQIQTMLTVVPRRSLRL